MQATAQLGMEVEETCYANGAAQENSFISGLMRRETAQRPTAIACWNDQTAYEMLAHCRRHGVRVPEDVAIVGFDGSSTAYENRIALTTIRAPWAEVARAAVLYLDHLLKGESVPQETTLPIEFVHGHTT